MTMCCNPYVEKDTTYMAMCSCKLICKRKVEVVIYG